MAKDGTMRGNKKGNYTGAGRKKKPLAERVVEGTVDVADLPSPVELYAHNAPDTKTYMQSEQETGELCAVEIYNETYEWLKKYKCDGLVPADLVSRYAMSVARWIQCEEAISKFGFLSKHPTTGAAIASPFVAMSKDYMRQINQNWHLIQCIVNENSLVTCTGTNPQDNSMEQLLTARSRSHEKT